LRALDKRYNFGASLLLSLLLLTAACSGGAAKPQSSATSRPSVATTRAATATSVPTASQQLLQQVAPQALLRLEDLPTGWNDLSSGKTGIGTPSATLPNVPSQCLGLAWQEQVPGSLMVATSPVFESTSPAFSVLTSNVTVYESSDAAHQPFVDLAGSLAQCQVPLAAALAQAFSVSGATPISASDLQINPLTLVNHGDEQKAIRVNDNAIGAYADLIGVRVGRVGAGLTWRAGAPPDTNEENRLLDILTQRLAAVAAQLPQ
jgi:hypothetical protein